MEVDYQGVSGLYFIKDYLNEEWQDTLDKYLSESVTFEPISSSANSRRTSHFGYIYGYNTYVLTPCTPIPEIFKGIVSSIESFLKLNLDQMIINEYKPGQRISAHIDAPKLFGDAVICISLGSSSTLKMELGTETVKINLPKGSCYIMTGDSRYKWKHSLINNSTETRYSLTYRETLKK